MTKREKIERSIRVTWRGLPEDILQKLIEGEIRSLENEKAGRKIDREGGLTEETDDDFEEAR